MMGLRIPHLPARVQRFVDEAVNAAARTREPLAERALPDHARGLRRRDRGRLVRGHLGLDHHELELVAQPADEEPERLGPEGIRVLAPWRHLEPERAGAPAVPAD